MSYRGPTLTDPRRDPTRPRCPHCSSLSVRPKPDYGWGRTRYRCGFCNAVMFAEQLVFDEPQRPRHKACGSGVVAGRRAVFEFRPLSAYPWDAHRALCEARRKP